MSLQIYTRVDDENKHTEDINTLVFAKGILYSGGDDGKIKMWEEDLKFIDEVQAHQAPVYSLTCSSDTLYSCSSDGTIVAWELGTLKVKIGVVRGKDEFWKVCYSNGRLYTGDSQGTIRIFKGNKLVGEDYTCDPIKDLAVLDDYVFTVRDSDLIITKFHPCGKLLKAVTTTNLVGKAPVALYSSKLIFTSRNGRDILMHENSSKLEFKFIGDVKDAHEMIINSLTGIKAGADEMLLSGGWDRSLKMWKINESEIAMVDKIPADFVIQAMTTGRVGTAYVGGGDGHLIRVDAI